MSDRGVNLDGRIITTEDLKYVLRGYGYELVDTYKIDDTKYVTRMHRAQGAHDYGDKQEQVLASLRECVRTHVPFNITMELEVVDRVSIGPYRT